MRRAHLRSLLCRDDNPHFINYLIDRWFIWFISSLNW